MTAKEGDGSGTYYTYGTAVFAFVRIYDDDVNYTYAPQSSWSRIAPPTSYRTYRVGLVQVDGTEDFGTIDAIVTANRYQVTILEGPGVSATYLSTTRTATSGDASGTMYDPGTTVYGFAIIGSDTAQYSYSAPSGWTQLAGVGKKYRVGEVVTNSDQDFGTMNAVATTRSYPVTFTLGDYVDLGFTSTNANATYGNASGLLDFPNPE